MCTNVCINVLFKRLGSQHIHKEIKLQKAMNRMDRILCKTNPIFIQRHTYKFNTFIDVDFEAFYKVRLCIFVVFTISIKAYFQKGVASFNIVTSI